MPRTQTTIKITTNPVSDAYSRPNEKRIEFSALREDVLEDGSYNSLMGGLISFTVIRADDSDVPEDKLVVHIYRTNPNVDVQWSPEEDLQPPRFGPRAVGGHVRVTGGRHTGWTGEITHVPDRTIIVIRLHDSSTLAVIDQNDAEPTARPR
jgi:hypothetical protein